MCKDGSLEKETDLRDFAQGFTQGKASFDFIDVGEGKADAKMEGKREKGSPICYRNHLRVLIRNLQRQPHGTSKTIIANTSSLASPMMPVMRRLSTS